MTADEKEMFLKMVRKVKKGAKLPKPRECKIKVGGEDSALFADKKIIGGTDYSGTPSIDVRKALRQIVQTKN